VKPQNIFFTLNEVGEPVCTFTDPFHDTKMMHSNDIWCLGKIIFDLVETVPQCDETVIIRQFLQERLLEPQSQMCTLEQFLDIVRHPSSVAKCVSCPLYILNPSLRHHQIPYCESCTINKLTKFFAYFQKQDFPFQELTRHFPRHLFGRSDDEDDDDVRCFCKSEDCENEWLRKVLDEKGDVTYICDWSFNEWYICQICDIKVLNKDNGQPSDGVFKYNTSVVCAACLQMIVTSQDHKTAQKKLVETHFHLEIQQGLLMEVQSAYENMLPTWRQALEAQVKQCMTGSRIREWLKKDMSHIFQNVRLTSVAPQKRKRKV
jgi:hypothetical protein